MPKTCNLLYFTDFQHFVIYPIFKKSGRNTDVKMTLFRLKRPVFDLFSRYSVRDFPYSFR